MAKLTNGEQSKLKQSERRSNDRADLALDGPTDLTGRSVRVDVIGRDGGCVPAGPLSYGSSGRSGGKGRFPRLVLYVGGDPHSVRTGSRRARDVTPTGVAVTNNETFADKLDPTSSTDDNALPLDSLVLDATDALDPAFGIDATFASVDLGSEDTFGGLVTDDLSPLTLSVLEQVSSRQDGRRGVVNGLDEGAAKGRVSDVVMSS